MRAPPPSYDIRTLRAAAALLIGLGISGLSACSPPKADTAAPPASSAAPTIPADILARLGRDVDDVVLTDQSGAARPWKSLNGAPRVVFFGFTHCPEICPSTLAALQAAQDQAGAEAKTIRIDFVSIDPSRDTPEALKAYFSSFGDHVRGLTGSEEAVGKVAKAFRAAYRRSDTGGGDYTMDHTTLVYLLDADGIVRDVVMYNAPVDKIAAQLKSLAARR